MSVNQCIKPARNMSASFQSTHITQPSFYFHPTVVCDKLVTFHYGQTGGRAWVMPVRNDSPYEGCKAYLLPLTHCRNCETDKLHWRRGTPYCWNCANPADEFYFAESRRAANRQLLMLWDYDDVPYEPERKSAMHHLIR